MVGISCYKRSWLIFIIVKMMLIISDERWKDGLFPSGALFHLSHLGPEFRVLCFLMSVPNRVWGAMGPPCLTYLATNSSSGGPSCIYLLQTCVCLVSAPAGFKTTRASEDRVPLLVQTWKLEGYPQ